VSQQTSLLSYRSLRSQAKGHILFVRDKEGELLLLVMSLNASSSRLQAILLPVTRLNSYCCQVTNPLRDILIKEAVLGILCVNFRTPCAYKSEANGTKYVSVLSSDILSVSRP
jgi:hypothetical protein